MKEIYATWNSKLKLEATSLCVWSTNHEGDSFDNVKLYVVIALKLDDCKCVSVVIRTCDSS